MCLPYRASVYQTSSSHSTKYFINTSFTGTDRVYWLGLCTILCFVGERTVLFMWVCVMVDEGEQMCGSLDQTSQTHGVRGGECVCICVRLYRFSFRAHASVSQSCCLNTISQTWDPLWAQKTHASRPITNTSTHPPRDPAQ